MKKQILLITVALVLLLSGCVVYSFYPLYTQKDLFPNDLLTGTWMETETENSLPDQADGIWKFEHPFVDEEKGNEKDSLSYVLDLKSKDGDTTIESKFDVHVIKLGDQYFLDFFLHDFFEDSEVTLATFHVIPVHTFAKLTIEHDRLIINWFDGGWLEKLVRNNKIRIHHEESAEDDFIMLTAKPQELQKFVTKYVNSEEAFEEGLEVVLYRK